LDSRGVLRIGRNHEENILKSKKGVKLKTRGGLWKKKRKESKRGRFEDVRRGGQFL
jgi:hypothetical protein